MLNRVLTAVVWILVPASALLWWHSARAPAPSAQAAAAVAPAADVHLAPIQQLLGAQPGNAETPFSDAHLHLSGVIATSPGPGGAALISINGKASRPYTLGAPIDGNLVLQSLSTRSVHVGPASGSTSIVLELPGH